MCSVPFDVRLRDIQRFYSVLEELEAVVGGKRTLGKADGRMNWPLRGVYFFFEPGEERTTSGTGPRVVRVGTHALKIGARTTLWKRLRQHRGTVEGACPGGGNHRGSVFRLHVGTALVCRNQSPAETAGSWGVGPSASPTVRHQECPLERAVSDHIRTMPFLWVGVNDAPGPHSQRGYIERNAIALLSNCSKGKPIDPPSEAWQAGARPTRWCRAPACGTSITWQTSMMQSFWLP